MNYTIYLIGQISKDEETYNWRKGVETYFKDNRYVTIINPCKSEFNIEALKTMVETNSSDKEVYKLPGINLLTPKDRRYVADSDAAIADFNLYDTSKPLLGTIYELAWYYDSPEKMVVGVYKGDIEDNVWTSHPFVQNTVHAWVKTHEEACELLESYMDI